MPDERLTPIWKALADPTRRAILDLLKERPRTTGELCAAFDRLSRFAVMKHLSVLEEANLVLVRPRGRERWNHLNAIPLQQIYERWLKPYEARWAASLLQLKQHIEANEGERTMAELTTPAVVLRRLHIEQEVAINASPERVFEALTNDISAWWGAPYLLTAAPQALILEPEVGGRFYETTGEGEGALHAIVTFIKKNEALELTGPIGMSGAVQGVVSLTLEPRDEATLLKLSHRAIGEINEETQASYSAGWQDLLGTRLKAFVESGTRSGLRRE